MTLSNYSIDIHGNLVCAEYQVSGIFQVPVITMFGYYKEPKLLFI